MLFSKKLRFDQLAPWVGKMIQHAGQYKYSVKADSHQLASTAV